MKRNLPSDTGHRDSLQDKLLQLIYNHAPGRALILPFTHPAISKIGGYILDSPVSRILIPFFVRSAHIDLSQCERPAGGRYRSFNDLFTRRLLPEARPFDPDPLALVSPCDARLTAYPISARRVFHIKQTGYRLEDLLRDPNLARRFAGGTALVFRLCVDDYHRYAWPDGGLRAHYRKISGRLHTVNPVANDHFPIYKENCREYTVVRSHHFGTYLMMEVGALMVGKIVNHHTGYTRTDVIRGQEKGYFAFGGSTIVLLFMPGVMRLDEEILEASARNEETRVRMGQRIGCAPGGKNI